jgi:tyrosine decarboxylase
MTSPACTEIETVVMDWYGKMLGLPETFLSHTKGGGVIQASASDAVFICLVAARAKVLSGYREEEHESIKSKLVVYASDQTHSSVKKACMVGGVS